MIVRFGLLRRRPDLTAEGFRRHWLTVHGPLAARTPGLLAQVGVDVIDVSSGGLTEETRRITVPRGLGFQVGFAERIRKEAGVVTQAVGMIVDGPQAEEILASGAADLVAIGRAALEDPYWPRRAAEQLGSSPIMPLGRSGTARGSRSARRPWAHFCRNAGRACSLPAGDNGQVEVPDEQYRRV